MDKKQSFCQKVLKTKGDGQLPSRYLKVRTLAPCDTTTGGIIMTDNAKEARVNTIAMAQVLAVGRDAYDKNSFDHPYCKEGDYIYFDFSEKRPFFMKNEGLNERLKFSLYYIYDYAVIDIIHPEDVERYGLLPYSDVLVNEGEQ